ncbi:MAG: SAM-dependent methyltransferase [Pseudomonadota bacterium]|nr:SAM-dependent methyltransferase [Pseudomonadota bacterium]
MPGYLTKQERIGIAGAADLTIRSLLDRQQYFDPHGDAERVGISSANWPLFGLVWPSGLQLASRIAARPVQAGERILEVGCGLALASLVAHRRGADVTASDCHPLAAEFLHENVRLNALAPLPYRHGDWAATEPPAEPSSVTPEPEGAPSRPEGAPSEDTVRGRFDLIIGSDVLYERDSGATLARFIGRHTGAAAEVWIVDPDRGNRPAFNRQMAELGFALREQHIAALASPGAAAYKGRMLIYSRSPP